MLGVNENEKWINEIDELKEGVDLNSAKERLNGLKEEACRQKEKGTKFDPHLLIVDPESLSRRDLEIFKKMMDDSLTAEEFKIYEKRFTSKKGISLRKRFLMTRF